MLVMPAWLPSLPATCPAPAGVLWSISPRLVLFLVCYALMGTLGTAWVFGRPLTALQQKILKLEADLRFGLVRLRYTTPLACKTRGV